MPETFFTFRIHAQNVGMAVVGGGLTLGAYERTLPGNEQIPELGVVCTTFILERNPEFNRCAMLLNAQKNAATQKLTYDFIMHTTLDLETKYN